MSEVFETAEKLDPEGGGGFQPPHRASEISPALAAEMFSADFTPKPAVIRSLFFALEGSPFAC
jgi:hypothetical protein